MPKERSNITNIYRHFAVWLDQHRIALSSVDEDAIERFAVHSCTCPGLLVQKARRNSQYLAFVRRFVRHLAIVGAIPSTVWGKQGDDRLQPFREWLRRHRGAGVGTILGHLHAITKLLPQLGDDPARYDAALINRVLLQNLESASRVSAQQMCGSLRMYLRFLTATGACWPGLGRSDPANTAMAAGHLTALHPQR